MQHDASTPFDHWARPIEDIDLEIGQLAVACGVPLLDPGVVERLLHNDSSVCTHDNPRGFEKLRQLLMMHFIVTEKTVEAIGAQHTQEITELIHARLKPRFGNQLHTEPGE
jgi:hypothetical protein